MSDDESKVSVVIGPILNTVPVVGGVLAAAWSEWDTGRRFARVEQTLRRIVDRLQLLDVNQSAASEAGMQLLELVLREAQLQHSEAKRKRLANVLVASWVDDRPPEETFDESILFLRAVSEFGDTHIAFLNFLYAAGPAAAVPFNELAKLVVLPLDRANAEASQVTLVVLNDLCSRFAFAKRAWDLNQPEKSGQMLLTSNLSPEGIARKCFHAITDRGFRFVKYILQGSNEPSGTTIDTPEANSP